jgi:hypothetical protein
VNNQSRRSLIETLLLGSLAVWIAAWLLRSAVHMVLSVLPELLVIASIAGLAAVLWFRYRHSDRW